MFSLLHPRLEVESMTQQEKAQEYISRIFRIPRYRRVGVSEKFLRENAPKHWVGKNEPLSADALLCEVENQVAQGNLKKFRRAQTWYYSPR